MTNLQSIQEQLQLAPSVSMSDSRALYGSTESLALLNIESPMCNAVIAVQGAQLLEFAPKDATPWLWLSPKAVFQEGHPVRGGIPVCAPWFGVNHQDATKPKHGFVRTQDWQLINITESPSGVMKLVFQFLSAKEDFSLFPHKFSLELTLLLSDHIDISFSVKNSSPIEMPFSWALHSYFCVDDLNRVRVTGLENNTYLDATNALTPITQSGAVCFKTEVDRVYESVDTEQVIKGSPSLSIKGTNCPTAIVWNPGSELAEKMADITVNHYDEYICVERGAAFGNTWRVPPGQSATAELTILKSH
ncbi:D-hexose-6-phosphate mutarotase [Alkalimarinus alittae]|uniref:Putative glucose-6-phosphate 1-epimerase n=1 Tax=Alkalimarinus alittae TaxID=2961619 RepID=A0ABY6N5N2_9ALTE|nr:D-hexose-6-phosphate mutarotase [Alkalimarinus alittae]UZE97396.1 D-hexose-6-phosphate mutarotase [Alkalimarinus alittae]